MEVDRFKRLDDKANNQLRFTYILITIYIALGKLIIIDITNNQNYIAYVLLTSSIIFLVLAWLNYFLSLKLTIVPKLPLTDEIINLFKEKELPTIQYALSESMKKAFNIYDKIIEKKAKKLHYGYNFTILSVITIIILTGYTSYNHINIDTKKEFKMNTNNKQEDSNNTNNQQDSNVSNNTNNQQDSNISNNEPDFNVDIPELLVATEGYQVDISKYKDLILDSQ